MSTVYMTEVEQIELIKKWWKRHHRVIVTSLSIILLLVSAGRYWQWHQQKHTEDASNAYEHLMVAFSGQDSESVQAYAELRGDIYYAQNKLQKARREYQAAKSDIEKSGVSSVFLEMKQHNLHASSSTVHTAHSLS